MISGDKTQKHIGEQKPLRSSSGDEGNSSQENNSDNDNNPLKPEETQKGINSDNKNYDSN
ncbi:hypothetical protein B6D52_03800 [Candidatus Parcubacteria bacterium 4484_255]|nr:MAG: hypothetical protein B6D52_03800 [Candidatus Parcubacteria bacterium 4484_255]